MPLSGIIGRWWSEAVKRVFCLICLVLCCSFQLAVAQAPDTATKLVSQSLSEWNVEDARSQLGALLQTYPDDPILVLLEAHLLYLEGKYAASVARYKTLPEALANAPGPAKRIAQAKQTEATLRPFSEHTTADGRFLIRYLGKDKIIIPYLTEVLEKAEVALSADFNYVPSSPILVEIYPTVEYLAAVSSLTKKDLKTSGTIALCSDNKLMLTSPRGLGRGYGWRDTIAHEFVHYYITKVSKNTVPIWLHEGIAKFQETRWRNQPGHQLEPPQEDLLARSLKADQLITFDQMHPSMALLPSQEAAALAFAEVHSTIRFLHSRGGYAKIRTLLSELASGLSMNRALAKTYGFDLSGLWKVWLKRTRNAGLKTYPGLVHMPLTFVRPDTEGEEVEAELMTIKEKRVKDLTHLGELLRARERPLAASKEYRKAMDIQGTGNPAIQNGLANSLLMLERPNEVPPLMKLVLKYYPDYARTHLNLGRAFIKLNRWKAAQTAFEKMIGINPFHPEVHEALVRIYTELGLPEKANRARKAAEIIRQ